MTQSPRKEPGSRTSADLLRSIRETLPPGEPAATVERVLIQEARPIVESLEWALSDAYWKSLGAKPFVRGDVPFVINNTAWNPESAAEVIFAACEETSPLPSPIALLELGAGLGLFARRFLDRFREICQERGASHYEGVLYLITDGSPATLEHWNESGMFDDHDRHLGRAVLDASDPEAIRAFLVERLGGTRPLGVFANYLFDSLPLTILRSRDDEGGVEEFRVEAYLSTKWEEEIHRKTGLAIEGIARLVRSDAGGSVFASPEELRKLLPIVPFLDIEASFQPVGRALTRVEEEAIALQEIGRRTIVNGAAARCLEACLELLHENGVALVHDLGPTDPEQVERLSYVARFGASLAACMNFPLLDHLVASWGGVSLRPEDDSERGIRTRLFSQSIGPKTRDAFFATYGDRYHERAGAFSDQALEHINAGRSTEALECFEKAVELDPNNWNLLGNVAQFLTQQLFRHEEARVTVERALQLNPWHSAFLWNTLGNAHYCLADPERAREAYEKALAIDPLDPQTHLNLSYIHTHNGDSGKALAAIARGLEHDVGGSFEAALLTKQKEILSWLGRRREEEREKANDRHRAVADTE